MKKKVKTLIGLVVLVVILLVIIYGYLQAAKPQPVILQGQMEADETHVSAKVSGRIGKILIAEGQKIQVGTAILRMDSPEIEAKVAQAKAVRDAATAVANKAQAGARKQEIQMAYQQMLRAQAGLEVREKTWNRIHHLAKEGLLSQQKADEAKAHYLSAKKQYETAKAQHNLATEGARIEDIAAAKAKARQGQAVVDEALVAQQETQLKSPVEGEVAEIIPHHGEIIAKGSPIVTVVDLTQQRLELNVREDYLKFFTMGKNFTGTIPALDNLEVSFKVYAIAVLPDFATWRPTRTDQGFDMKTFLVKSTPQKPIANMRPGMSVLVKLPD